MVADDFAACLDADAIEKGGLADVPDIIAQVQLLFPIEDYSSNKTLSHQDYEKYSDAVAYLNSIGTGVFGDFGTAVDVQNPVRYYLTLRPSALLTHQRTPRSLPITLSPLRVTRFSARRTTSLPSLH